MANRLKKTTVSSSKVPEALRTRIVTFMGTCQAYRFQIEGLDSVMTGAEKKLQQIRNDKKKDAATRHDQSLFYKGAINAYKLQREAFDKLHQEAETELERLDIGLKKYL